MVETPEKRSNPDHLDATDQDLLTMLLPSSLREEVIGARVRTTDLTPQQLSKRLRNLAKRGLVAHIPAPWGSIWCLTKAGRPVAEKLQRQEELDSQRRLPMLFDEQEETP